MQSLATSVEELSPFVDLAHTKGLKAVTFSANSEYLVGGGDDGVQVWRVQDGKKMATMQANRVWCVAVSKDGRWIAAGTLYGGVFLWDAKTYEQVWMHTENSGGIRAIDFSPNSTRLIYVSRGTATVLDVATSKQVQTLNHYCIAVKYSPDGTRIAAATAGRESVQVWDSSHDGQLLVDIRVSSSGDQPLLWFDNHLFVISDDEIKRFEASTGTEVSRWSVPRDGAFPCIVLPRHGEFITYSSGNTVTCWDTSTHTQLSHIQQPEAIISLALSPDDRLLAIGLPGKITSIAHHSYITDAALRSWEQNCLVDVEASLTETTSDTRDKRHLALATRALVRSQLQYWDLAIEDAEKSIGIEPSITGYIAMSVALIGNGQKEEGCRVFDLAFRHCDSTDMDILLLIKAVVLFMAGKHNEAVSRVGDLIPIIKFNAVYYVVQAMMRLQLGNSHMESGDYESAIHSFGLAQSQMPYRVRDSFLIVSLISGWRFNGLAITIRQRLCETLYAAGHTMDAGKSLLELVDTFGDDVCMNGSMAEWISGTSVDEVELVLGEVTRILGKLESLGDSAMNAGRHSAAISHYSAALALRPAAPPSLFVKRSKAYVAGGLGELALNDANKVIELDPSSPWGYERKHAALHKAGDYANAINAFETMLSKISQSSDPEIRRQHRLYINPGDARMAIRHAVQDAIRDSPRVLINTVSGRLVHKSEQVSASEPFPAFNKLISSMTTNIDRARIEQDVTEYYRYAMFSHRWDFNEPLFETVKDIPVYNLEASPTNDKLRMFCKIVRDAGLHWAWSDTCCINKADHFVLQEALVSMFKWYQGAAQTLVLLRGVRSPSRRGDLVRSIWNSRVWTFQEYHASKVVRFYNEDWTLYMNLDIPNHKESPEILSEMEEATGISAQALMALQPGLDDIREKLCLASTRQTTLLEDEAYSLLGIFSLSLPVVYGEGDQALGRLLSQLVTSSGDTRILAWTGKSGRFNSCLPARISVFSQPLTSQIPRTVTETEMETITARLRNASLSLNSITKLYDRLDQLRVPSFSGKRMTLPCITFKLGPVLVPSSRSERIFQAQTVALGKVEIRTEEDLSRFKSLYLVHPWIDHILDRQPVGSVLETLPEESTDDQSSTMGKLPSLPAPRSRTAQLASRFGLSFGRQTATRPRDGESLRPPSSLSQTDKQTRALHMLARLSQPFGALLLTPSGNVAAYRRVATERAITVQVEEITPAVLNKLIEGVSVLDVL
ncbi:hypothetical protein EV363DRAFT_1400038 [Boletus edulis]|nr:hypothetical protein EV363DRAFT_1400038 [Boletus edulis]